MKTTGIFMALALCACSGGGGPSIGRGNNTALVVVDYDRNGKTTVDGVPVDSSMVLAEVKKKAGNGRLSMIHFISNTKASYPEEDRVVAEIRALCKDRHLEFTWKVPSGCGNLDGIVMVESKRGGLVMVDGSPFDASAALGEIRKLADDKSVLEIAFASRGQESFPGEDKLIAKIRVLCKDAHVKFSITYPARDADDLAGE